VWPCIESRAIAELRLLRAKEQPAKTLADLADQLQRGVPIDWPPEQLLMAKLVIDYKAENERLRAAHNGI